MSPEYITYYHISLSRYINRLVILSLTITNNYKAINISFEITNICVMCRHKPIHILDCTRFY